MAKKFLVKAVLVESDGNDCSGTFKETLISSVTLDTLRYSEIVNVVKTENEKYLVEIKVSVPPLG